MVTSKQIAIKELHFDPENPRIPEEIRREGDEAVLRWMLGEGEILELMRSIASTGFSPSEPLLITKNNSGPGFIVVEGNRRLAAVKLLTSPNIAPIRKKAILTLLEEIEYHAVSTLPTLVYPSRDDILDFLGFRHITGIRAWGALAKANYLKQLFDKHFAELPSVESTIRSLANIIGSKPYYVNKLLIAHAVITYAIDEGFWGNKELLSAEINFSVFATAIGYENIKEYLGLPDKYTIDLVDEIDKGPLIELLMWIAGKKIE